MEKIQIPNSVTGIQGDAFFECTGLKNIEIPDSVYYLSAGVFDGCTSLENIKLSKNISSLGRYVFRECIKLKNIQLPSSLKTIATEAFIYCSSLTDIDIPDSVTIIGDRGGAGGVFYGCTSLTNIHIPDGIANMSTSETFYECSSLATIKIPDVVTEIGYEAFKGCNNLDYVILKRNITKIHKTAFDYSSAVVICNKNSNAHKDAENNKIAYKLDDEAPEITFEANGNTKKQKSVKVKVSAVDKMIGLEEDSLKYLWSTEKNITKEEMTAKLENEAEINSPENATGNYYLYVYAKDKLDNETITKSNIYHLDNTAPKPTVRYSTTNPTNQDIKVEIQADEEIQGVTGWSLSTDKKTLTKKYTQNTTEEVTIMDVAGNGTNTRIKIENIDRVIPTLEIGYNTTSPMAESVTATITAKEELQELEDWILSDDKKSLSKEFTYNINQDIFVKDIAGNEASIQVTINNIKDITPPNPTVFYSTTNPTNQDIKVEIKADEEIQGVTGWNLLTDKKTLTKTYTQNTTEEVIVKDLVGNETKKTIQIDNIVQVNADINENSQIDSDDLLALLRHMAQDKSSNVATKHPEWKLDDKKMLIGDLNKNNEIDTSDILRVQRYIAASNSQKIAEKHPGWLNIEQ